MKYMVKAIYRNSQYFLIEAKSAEDAESKVMDAAENHDPTNLPDIDVEVEFTVDANDEVEAFCDFIDLTKEKED